VGHCKVHVPVVLQVVLPCLTSPGGWVLGHQAGVARAKEALRTCMKSQAQQEVR
jgi:hypothetical protein